MKRNKSTLYFFTLLLPLLIIAPCENIISQIKSGSELYNIIIMLASMGAAMISHKLLPKRSVHRIIASMMGLSVIVFIVYAFLPTAVTGIAVSALVGWVTGSIDYFVQLNVLQRYEFSHMNWLHSAWGIGAAIGVVLCIINEPRLELIFTAVYIALLMIAFLLSDRFLIKEAEPISSCEHPSISISQYGFGTIVLCCIIYNSIQNLILLYGKQYMTSIHKITSESAHIWLMIFYVLLFVSRFLSGFLAIKLSFEKIVRIAQGITLAGIILLFIPSNNLTEFLGIAFIGIGCAPFYPGIIYQNKRLFTSGSIPFLLGIEIAAATLGGYVIPRIFDKAADDLIAWFPFALLILVLFFTMLNEKINIDRLKYRSSQVAVITLEKHYDIMGVMNPSNNLIHFIKNDFSAEYTLSDFNSLINCIASITSDAEDAANLKKQFENSAVFSDTINFRQELQLNINGEECWYSFQFNSTGDKEMPYFFALKNIDEYHLFQLMGTTDIATGLQNKNSYLQTLKAIKDTYGIACIYIDLNGLHSINNQYGHSAGDKMIRNVASALCQYFRSEECFRIGGDEFVVISSVTYSEAAEKLNGIKERLNIKNVHISAGISVGGSNISVADMIENADNAMLKDKEIYYQTHTRG